MAASPKYDPQREELYRMERLGLPGLNRARYTRADMKRLLELLSKAFGIDRPRLTWVASEEWSGLWSPPGTISLSTSKMRSGRSPLTLVHEFAHHVQGEWDPYDYLEPHGPEFAAIYGDCLGMAGLIPWHGWQELCEQYGVKCLDTRAIRTVSGLQRRIKKRAAEAARKYHHSPTNS